MNRQRRLRFSFSLRFPLDPFLPLLRTDKSHTDKATDRCDHRPTTPPQPNRRTTRITAGAEINADFSLTFKIFGIEFNFEIFLLALRLYQKGIAKIVVVQMKHRFVVAISIRPHNLTI